jgi:hypothetical protein
MSIKVRPNRGRLAGVAHQVEHIIRNDGVVGSSPITGTISKTQSDTYKIYCVLRVTVYQFVSSEFQGMVPSGQCLGTLIATAIRELRSLRVLDIHHACLIWRATTDTIQDLDGHARAVQT